jgi:trans-aconitate methyltransferase
LRGIQVPAADFSRVNFQEADLRNWRPDREQYDLIVTNFVLDCFDADELAQIIPRFAAATTSDANWLIADFSVPGVLASTASARR